MIQDDLIGLVWEHTPGSFSSEFLQRLPAETDEQFVARIIAKMKALSGTNEEAVIYVYTAVVGGNTTFKPLNVIPIDPSFIDELLGGGGP